METYRIESIKTKEQFSGSLEDAIVRANEIRDEYDPAFGVQVENESGDCVYDTEDTE